MLLSKGEVKKRKNHPEDVKAVFGQIKYNKKFNRLNLRSLKKVEVELGLMALVHNLTKIATYMNALFLILS
ncbi:hypothetical protein GCM10011506_39830 [Marivirga lumbricoides]|uniref:Transposase DDE domain-containing protein n=1 Tax=Marivirga lumbricoides TaxID=1046115 RepID=A0ABQ1N0H6_9BACT|nr:hypothetical protein GCM10011506_39830 [Marivirga lumbricoides]